MSDQPCVILSGFADEAANQKTAVEQFAAFAALGLEYYSIRFIDVGEGIKNVMKLTQAGDPARSGTSERVRPGRVVDRLADRQGQAAGRRGRHEERLHAVQEVSRPATCKKACELAHAFETKLIRGFSFYPPRGSDPREHLAQAVDQLGQIAETCHRSDLTFGLEVEANLVGCNGHLLAEIHRQVNHPAMVLIFDAANILVQGYTPAEVFEQYLAMKPGLGWMHIKDYRSPQPVEQGRPRRRGCPGALRSRRLGRQLATTRSPRLRRMLARAWKHKLGRRGIPGVFFDLEPHLKGGGQFGGFSGPDGMGVALRGLCRVLDYVGIDYHLRDFDDIKAARGF